MTKRVAIVQSNYVPWKGYFDLVRDADLFVFYDDLQYTKRDWRNRNKIKTPRGAEWMTIPVGQDVNRLICEVELRDPTWQSTHWRTLQQNYGKCPHFARYHAFFDYVYRGRTWSNLSDLNQFLIRTISADILDFRTEFRDSREYRPAGRKLERLMDLAIKTGADCYISGPSAQDYIEPSKFAEAGIELVWKDYSGYPEYPQRFPPFQHGVSILDLLFNVGPEAPWYIGGWREGQAYR